MLLKFAFLTICLSCTTISCRGIIRITTTPASAFCIPDVDIEVYQPKGFRVSIPHGDGIQMFAFHASINKKMKNYEVGQYYKDVMYPVNGKWVYEEKSAKLKIGDKIYFWVYVLHNKLGYRRDDQLFKVTELITDPFPEDSYYPSPSVVEEESKLEVAHISSAAASIPQKPPTIISNDNCIANLTNYERIILDNSQKIYQCDKENAELKKNNALLKNIIERNPNGRKLTLSGRISREDNPVAVVKFIINEKLGLSPFILSAVRNSDLSITFELESVDDLVRVISESKVKLADSKTITISY